MCWWLLGLGAWITLMGLSAAHGVYSIGALAATGGYVSMVWPVLTAQGLRVSTHRR
jgi:fucose permease